MGPLVKIYEVINPRPVVSPKPLMPEQIYLLPDEKGSNGIAAYWAETPAATGCAEYTRTDVFVEKACEWLRLHAKNYYSREEGCIAPGQMLADFKLAMSGVC